MLPLAAMAIASKDEVMKRLPVSSEAIARRSSNELGVDEFWRLYMCPNTPVMIGGVTDGWRCCEWVRDDATLNTAVLRDLFGGSTVKVIDCSDDFTSYECTLHEFANRWEEETAKAEGEKHALYLKDWNLHRHVPDYGAYSLPEYFAEVLHRKQSSCCGRKREQ